MILNKKYTLTFAFLLALVGGQVSAQSTVNSPYSKFGVGNLSGSYLPQYKALGNLAYGISTIGGYQNLNISNPASYSEIRLTVFDVGARANSQTLSKAGLSEKSFNASLNHFAIGVPVTRRSALSFGILPYSNLGYDFKNTSKVDTFSVDHRYQGEGGLTKAYLGYGIGITKHISIGANMSYLFGNLRETKSTEFPLYIGFLNSRTEDNNFVGGLNFDFGVQYVAALNKTTKLTVGYTGGFKTKLNTTASQLSTRYQLSGGTEYRSDSTSFVDDIKGSVVFPTNHNFGFSIEKGRRWLFGADLRLAKWSQFSKNGVNQNLQDSWGVSVGGQLTPNLNSVTKYWKLVDYRMGVSYDKTNLKLNNTDIKVQSLNLGLGLPLVANRSAFYKINLSAEIGKRGTLSNNLVKENFANFYVGFTINDKWFQKYKYD